MANINSIGNNPKSSELERVLLVGEGFNLDKHGEQLKSATFWGRPGGTNPYAAMSRIGSAGLTDDERETLADASYTVFSYLTPIAWKMADGRWMVPEHEHSPTTRQHILTILAGLSNIDVRWENGNLARP